MLHKGGPSLVKFYCEIKQFTVAFKIHNYLFANKPVTVNPSLLKLETI